MEFPILFFHDNELNIETKSIKKYIFEEWKKKQENIQKENTNILKNSSKR